MIGKYDRAQYISVQSSDPDLQSRMVHHFTVDVKNKIQTVEIGEYFIRSM